MITTEKLIPYLSEYLNSFDSHWAYIEKLFNTSQQFQRAWNDTTVSFSIRLSHALENTGFLLQPNQNFPAKAFFCKMAETDEDKAEKAFEGLLNEQTDISSRVAKFLQFCKSDIFQGKDKEHTYPWKNKTDNQLLKAISILLFFFKPAKYYIHETAVCKVVNKVLSADTSFKWPGDIIPNLQEGERLYSELLEVVQNDSALKGKLSEHMVSSQEEYLHALIFDLCSFIKKHSGIKTAGRTRKTIPEDTFSLAWIMDILYKPRNKSDVCFYCNNPFGQKDGVQQVSAKAKKKKYTVSAEQFVCLEPFLGTERKNPNLSAPSSSINWKTFVNLMFNTDQFVYKMDLECFLLAHLGMWNLEHLKNPNDTCTEEESLFSYLRNAGFAHNSFDEFDPSRVTFIINNRTSEMSLEKRLPFLFEANRYILKANLELNKWPKHSIIQLCSKIETILNKYIDDILSHDYHFANDNNRDRTALRFPAYIKEKTQTVLQNWADFWPYDKKLKAIEPLADAISWLLLSALLLESFTDLSNWLPEKTNNTNKRYNIKHDYVQTNNRMENGDINAAFELATLSFYGLGCVKNYKTAFDMFEKVANSTAANDEQRAAAFKYLGHMYYQGIVPGEEQNYVASYHRTADSAKYSNSALSHLGFLEINGSGCEPNFSIGIEKYKKAVENNGDISTVLACADLMNKHGFFKEATVLYSRIHEKSPLAAYQLGLLYKNGLASDNNRPDYNTARRYFEEATKTNNSCCADAYIQLGKMYFNPIPGFTKDFEKALKYFQYADERGNTEASYYLGYMYQYGHVIQCNQLAVDYYTKAYEGGNVDAAVKLACIYQENWERQDLSLAFKYAKFAAEQGSAEGNFIYGNALFTGSGGECDYDEAELAYLFAYNHGFLLAKVMLDKLYAEKNKLERRKQ